MNRKRMIVLLFSLISAVCVAKSHEPTSKLFLVGGGLKTCSSMSLKSCQTVNTSTPQIFTDAKRNNVFSLKAEQISQLSKQWPSHYSGVHHDKLIRLLKRVRKKYCYLVDEKNSCAKNIDKSTLISAIKKYDTQRLLAQLSDREYYFMLDMLEQPVMANNGVNRLKEQVKLTDSRDYFSVEIYQRFVELAQQYTKKTQPYVVVLTASARDPFEAADFYQSVFAQAGARSEWLPLDATLNAILQLNSRGEKACSSLENMRNKVQGSANRQSVYPDLVAKQHQACNQPSMLLEKLKQADGLFINGGDQSLTRKAFINHDGSDNQFLRLIKEKLANNQMVVGGTSAGTAVMSSGEGLNANNAMISNGQSKVAIVRGAKKDQLPVEGCHKSHSCLADLRSDDLTYVDAGGIGLFRWGIMDTHFSERGRQGRLAKLLVDSQARFAFGVDEATALVVDNIAGQTPEFSVVGSKGVYIAENTHLNATKPQKVVSVNSYYLSRGDKATLIENTLSIDFAKWKSLAKVNAKLPRSIEQIFDDSRYQQSAELLCRTNNQRLTATSVWQDNKHQITITKKPESQSAYGVLQVKNEQKSYCSYAHYQLSITSI